MVPEARVPSGRVRGRFQDMAAQRRADELLERSKWNQSGFQLLNAALEARRQRSKPVQFWKKRISNPEFYIRQKKLKNKDILPHVRSWEIYLPPPPSPETARSCPHGNKEWRKNKKMWNPGSRKSGSGDRWRDTQMSGRGRAQNAHRRGHQVQFGNARRFRRDFFQDDGIDRKSGVNDSMWKALDNWQSVWG